MAYGANVSFIHGAESEVLAFMKNGMRMKQANIPSAEQMTHDMCWNPCQLLIHILLDIQVMRTVHSRWLGAQLIPAEC